MQLVEVADVAEHRAAESEHDSAKDACDRRARQPPNEQETRGARHDIRRDHEHIPASAKHSKQMEERVPGHGLRVGGDRVAGIQTFRPEGGGGQVVGNPQIERVPGSDQIVSAPETLEENEAEEQGEQRQCQCERPPVVPRHVRNAVYRAGFPFAFASGLRRLSTLDHHFS